MQLDLVRRICLSSNVHCPEPWSDLDALLNLTVYNLDSWPKLTVFNNVSRYLTSQKETGAKDLRSSGLIAIALVNHKSLISGSSSLIIASHVSRVAADLLSPEPLTPFEFDFSWYPKRFPRLLLHQLSQSSDATTGSSVVFKASEDNGESSFLNQRFGNDIFQPAGRRHLSSPRRIFEWKKGSKKGTETNGKSYGFVLRLLCPGSSSTVDGSV
ncbi:hypothetical protein C8J56DRAFT_1054947 [Mycena floridula]|nr:hypothetical protein C8J56DRAFT_1054947 [Mycena floridula]